MVQTIFERSEKEINVLKSVYNLVNIVFCVLCFVLFVVKSPFERSEKKNPIHYKFSFYANQKISTSTLKKTCKLILLVVTL